MFDKANPAGWTDDNTVITAAQINKLDTNQSRGIDGTGGSNGTPYTPSTVIEVAGQGLKLSGVGNLGKVQLSSRSFTRVQNTNPYADTAGDWIPVSSGGALFGRAWSNVNLTTALKIPLELPHGATLTALSVRVRGVGGHGALPATKPVILIVESLGSDDTATSVGTATDASVDVTAYQGAHSITVSGITWSIDRNLARYHVVLTAEGGANSIVGMKYFSVIPTWTQTYMDDGAA